MNEPSTTRVPLPTSWQQIEDACSRLAGLMDELFAVRQIIAVSRGGLVPAALIGYRLNVKVSAVPPIRRTNRDDLVIIDDICDTGRTFERLRPYYPYALFAALYVKPQGKDICLLWATEVAQSDWVVFPWAPNDEVNR